MLLGCAKAVDLTGGGTSSSSSSVNEHLLHKTDLLRLLFQRISREPEPPLRNLTLQLLCNLTRLIPLIKLDISTQNILTNGWQMMNTIATSEHTNILSDASTYSENSGIKKNVIEKEVYGIENEFLPTLVCTEPASLGLEIMGWIIAG